MVSSLYYNIHEVEENKEMVAFKQKCYDMVCKSDEYNAIIRNYGSMCNIKDPYIYYHNTSSTCIIDEIIKAFTDKCIFISIDDVVNHYTRLLRNKEVKFSVLDNITAQKVVCMDENSKLYNDLISKNVFGSDKIKYNSIYNNVVYYEYFVDLNNTFKQV